MPSHKSLVKRCYVEVAQRQRKCKFSRTSIPRGSVCLVVYEAGGQRFCYSSDVAREMIRTARARLDDIESELTE